MTEERKIQIVAEVDATAARSGFNEISREAGAMAASVERSSQSADRAVSNVGNGASAQTRKTEVAQRSLIGSIERTTAAAEAGGRSTAAYFEVLGRQRGIDPTVLEPYLVQLRQVEAAQARAAVANTRGAASFDRVGMSAGQTAAALQSVPAQFTDIITSLQGGQAPLTVLIQQGGQLSDMFGGVEAAARALGNYLRTLITPYTVAVGAVTGLAVAYHYGSKEADAYARALGLTGNAAGATSNQLAEMASDIGAISGSQGKASEAVAAIAATGQVSADNLQRFATVAVEAQKVIGRSVADTAAEFSALKDAPLAALDKINDKYHFITAATYAQVKALQDQGRASEAAEVAQNAYADAVINQKEKVMNSLSDWERGWIRIKSGISGAVDAIFDFGRAATNSEKITSLLKTRETIESNLASAQQMRDTKAAAAWQVQLDRNKEEINGLRSKTDAERAAAKAEAEAADVAAAKNKWLAEGDKYLSRAAQLEREVTRARNEGAAAQLSSAEIEKRVGDIRKKYADIYNDGIDSNIEAVRRRAAVEAQLSQRGLDKVAFERSAGLLSEEKAIERTTAIELESFESRRRALVRELELVSRKQNSRDEQQEVAGEIALIEAERVSRSIRGENELFLLEQRRTRLASDNYANVVERAAAEREGMAEQVKAQRDYNEEIGLTTSELVKLTSARLESLAVRKDEDADIAEGLDMSGRLAQSYREQAQALRDRAAAERDGFVKQRDPWVNLTQSVKEYGEAANNVGAQISDAMTNGFRSAEDAFVSFVTTGKVSFAGLATSILADIARIQARKAIAGLVNMAVGSFFGGSSPSSGPGSTGWDGYGNTLAGARANGGPVSGGSSYLVGERGPEIFTPRNSGTIIPNHEIGGSSGITINTSVNVANGSATSQTSGDASSSGRALSEMVSSMVKDVVVREMRQGGAIWAHMNGRA